MSSHDFREFEELHREFEELHSQPVTSGEKHLSQRGGPLLSLPLLPDVMSGEVELSKRSANLDQFSLVGKERLESPLPLNLPADIPENLRPFARLIGSGLRKDGDPTTYRQILPENIWKAAVKNFANLTEGEQRMFLEILEHFDISLEMGLKVDLKTDNDLLAISTMFSMLAYGASFLRAFLEDGKDSCIASLQMSNLYSDVQQNFEQNYLNTCVAASMFTALSTAFVGNIKLLSGAIGMEIEQIKNKLQEQKEDKKLSDPAFSGHSWRTAPAIREEVERRIAQCEATINSIASVQMRTVTNPGIGKAEKEAIIENCQKELLRAYERMCAIRNVFCDKNIRAPKLLSLRPIQCFVGACVLTFAGNILAKAASLGFYVSSLSPSERLVGIDKITSPFFNDSGQSTSSDTWEKTFKNGIMLEERPGHAVARKAAFDGNGNRVFVIYDPIKTAPEVVPVSA
jgi:hypothetical protein